jgi:hypothetical protein
MCPFQGKCDQRKDTNKNVSICDQLPPISLLSTLISSVTSQKSKVSLCDARTIRSYNDREWWHLAMIKSASGIGSFMASYHSLICKHCGYLNVLDRSDTTRFRYGRIPLEWACFYCGITICTGCHDPVESQNMNSKKRKFQQEEKHLQPSHSNHKSYIHRTWMPYDVKWLGPHGHHVNILDSNKWTPLETQYRPMFLFATLQMQLIRCPKCQVRVDPPTSCTHMCCPHCNIQFCLCCYGILFDTWINYDCFAYKEMLAPLFMPNPEQNEYPLTLWDSKVHSISEYSLDLHNLGCHRYLQDSSPTTINPFPWKLIHHKHLVSKYAPSCPLFLHQLVSMVTKEKDAEGMKWFTSKLSMQEIQKQFQLSQDEINLLQDTSNNNAMDCFGFMFQIWKLVKSARDLCEMIGFPMFNAARDELKYELKKHNDKTSDYTRYASELDRLLMHCALHIL